CRLGMMVVRLVLPVRSPRPFSVQVKLGYECLPDGRLDRLTAVSHHVAETLNRAVNPQAPYVGSSAFAHKAGLHVSAIARRKDAYEHIDPEVVGNGTRFVVSEMAGRATIQIKADELGIELDGAAVNNVIDELKRLEHEGYHFEAADASLELLLRRAAGGVPEFFSVESMRVITDELPNGQFSTEATVKVWVGDGDAAERHVWVAEGNGPVNAIDIALRKAVGKALPHINDIHLTDYKVRILDGGGATGATTRVLVTASDGERDWTTIGVSPNIIEASWRALDDSLVYGLLGPGR
ncbi:MAG: alpha-isopropylmalate synthase regulatory domain-containing protein, partial [Actinomycetota bacterium]